MKHALLFFLVLPLTAFGQYNRTYTGPTLQQNQQSRDHFNRSMQQQQRDFQQRVQQRQMNQMGQYNTSRPAMTEEEQRQAQAKQLQLEQAANEQLAQLGKELQQQRETHPAPDAEQAAIQQKKDARQLTRLAVKNYREVFLPGQVTRVQQAQELSANGQRQLGRLRRAMADNAWWKKQPGAQLTSSVKAYGDTLTLLTNNLLGFDLNALPPVPAPFVVRGLEAQFAADVFDPNAANQLLQDAALTTKLFASKELIRAVKDFSALTTAPGPERQNDPKQLRDDVQASLRLVMQAMSSYYSLLESQTTIENAKDGLLIATSGYLAQK